MKIFSAAQIKKWDEYTIAHEPVTSIDLMERAATACYQWLLDNHFLKRTFKIFCGKGNNGGDGLALARMLVQNKSSVLIYVLEAGNKPSEDFSINLERLQAISGNIHFISSEKSFPLIYKDEVIVDALFGTGLNKALKSLNANLVHYINNSNATIISIDVPSGLFADKSSQNNIIIKANITLTFQQKKLAFMMAENEVYFGDIHVLDIGLHKNFIVEEAASSTLIDEILIKTIYKTRSKFSHKGNFGHACLVAGSYGMMGAAVLSANACLRSGVGKLTCFIPEKGYKIMQISAPEAMSKVRGKKVIEHVDDEIENFDAVGIGPGIGMFSSHADLLEYLFKNYKKSIVIDADALNTISENKELFSLIPPESILTPHPKEFEKLFGKSKDDFARMELALQKADQYKIYIVLKGHYTIICTPGKQTYFNSTGNAGMATGGSGDVLTGLLTGLLAQTYSPLQACILGVYLHGLAGDIAAEKISEEALLAGDIIDNLGEAFKIIHKKICTYKNFFYVV